MQRWRGSSSIGCRKTLRRRRSRSRDVTLDVADGEFVVLLGPSGCGKTTTLRMIAGFVEPSGGARAIGERDVTQLPPWRRNTGMVFQSYALFPHMTVAENVAFGLEMRKTPSAEIARRVGEVLRLVRLERLGERLPRQLSGGQQQRVALARALVIRPDVLLLDEPLSNLDAKLRQEVRVEIRELQRKLGLTTIMVTHDQEEALTMADRLVVMEDGAIRQIGTPARSLRAPGRPVRRRLRRPLHLHRRARSNPGTVSFSRAVSPSSAMGRQPVRRRWHCGRSGSASPCESQAGMDNAFPAWWNSSPISAQRSTCTCASRRSASWCYSQPSRQSRREVAVR